MDADDVIADVENCKADLYVIRQEPLRVLTLDAATFVTRRPVCGLAAEEPKSEPTTKLR